MKHKLSERIKNFNITILISLFLLLSCGSGQQAANSGSSGTAVSNSLIELGRSAENVFYSFMTLVSDTLGFTAKSTTKKEDVGGYFSSIGVKLEAAANDLEQVAVKATAGVDTSDASKNPIRVAVDAAKTTLNTLKGYVESLGQVGDSQKVGEAATNTQGTIPADDELKKAYNALKGIVKEAGKVGVPEPKAGDSALNVTGVDNKDGAKILSTSVGGAAATDAGKAAAIVSSVRGEEILASIIKSGEGDAQLGAAPDANTSAISFAKGGANNQIGSVATPKAAAVAGGIALRSLVKSGKLASGAADAATGGKEDVQAVGIDATNKLLVAIEDIIKETVKKVFDKVKQEVDKARAPKPAGQQ
ncbi:variable large family protein [Borrelia turicatae]|uniref:variable large family protein n=1 Tax=Borrelia turicatae TaxID=142 RepID=UPI001FF14ED4|nr:variable large family protein [Borrelia turicatae]UPA15685.1 variable large family protein [Borrelia turicatae]